MSETPILDLELATKEPSKLWLQRVLALLVGSTIGLLLILSDEGGLPDWHWPRLNGLLLVPALYVAIGIHELGHLIAGRLAGFDTGGIAIGGFVWVKSGRNWIFRFDPRCWMGGYFKPLTSARVFRLAPFTWMVAGGPLASLCLTMVFLAICIRTGSGAWFWAGSVFWATAFLSFISTIPFTSGLTRSDGARLLLLQSRPEQARSWVCLLGVQTEEAHGVRPREWDPDLFHQALGFERTAAEYPFCQLMAYYRHLDQGEESMALQNLENALARSSRSGKLFRHVLFLEAAGVAGRDSLEPGLREVASVRKRLSEPIRPFPSPTLPHPRA